MFIKLFGSTLVRPGRIRARQKVEQGNCKKDDHHREEDMSSLAKVYEGKNGDVHSKDVTAVSRPGDLAMGDDKLLLMGMIT